MITTASYLVFAAHRQTCLECNPKELGSDVMAHTRSYQSSVCACPAFALAHARYRRPLRQRCALPLKKRRFFCGTSEVTLIKEQPKRRKCPVTTRTDTY